jgi:hypothetical protein
MADIGVALPCLRMGKIYVITYTYVINIDVCKNSAGMVLTNKIEHYMQQWNYIKIRQLR